MSTTLFTLFDSAPVSTLAPGQTLFLAGQPVGQMFWVVQGQLQLRRHTPQGDALILQNATARAILAEASAYSSHYHCDAVVVSASKVASIAKASFLQAMDAQPALARAWASQLARSVQAARVRAEIRSLPTVSARLQAWLDEGNAMPEKGRWQALAAELSVTREALYRELAKRRTSNHPSNKGP